MHVWVTVSLVEGENFGMAPEDAAAAVLAAVGGDPAGDVCGVEVRGSVESGTAGAVGEVAGDE